MKVIDIKSEKQQTGFKTCTVCAHCWPRIVDLIRDESLYINGYQASFSDSREGLFLFTHDIDGCGTTLAISAGALKKLYTGPEHTIHMAYTERCEGHCMHGDDLAPCTNDCDMRWARDILQVLKAHGPEERLKALDTAEHPDVPARAS